MGRTCCGAKDVKYEFEGKTRTVSRKDATTIERFSAGSSARIQTKKLKENFAREITSLPYPSGETLKDPKIQKGAPMMSDKAFTDYMAGEGANLRWNNYSQKLTGDAERTEYRGHWSPDGKEWTGIGEVKYANGSLYQGFTKKKQPNGLGRMTTKDGGVTQGNFKDGKISGNGAVLAKGALYNGDYQNGLKHGKGTYIWNNGSYIYTGDFVKDEMTGKGKLQFDGNNYQGDFVNGNMHGNGKYYFAETQRTITGEFANNEVAGKGQLVYPDGSVYDGGFKAGQRSGQGTHTFATGKYVGAFQNDKYHGAGVMFDNTNGWRRQGEWKNGKRSQWLKEALPYQYVEPETKTQPEGQRFGGRPMTNNQRISTAILAQGRSSNARNTNSRMGSPTMRKSQMKNYVS